MTETRLGRLLRLQPSAIQASITARYPELELERGYACRPGGCAGVFSARGGSTSVTFGRLPTGQRFVNIWR